MSGLKVISAFSRYYKSVGLYFVASLIPMVLNLITNPLIAMNMSPKDYAITGYYSSFTTLLSPFITFYMFHYYAKCFFECNEEGRNVLKSTICKALIWFSGILSAVSFLGVLLYVINDGDSSELPISPYLALTVFAIPLAGLFTLMQTDLRMRRETGAFFRLTVINGALLTGMNLLMVAVFKMGALGKTLAPFLIQLIFFVFCLYKYKNLIKIPFDWVIFKRIFRFCLPLTLAAMLGFFANGYDRVYLERLNNVTELGYYVVGIQIAMYINVFQNAIGSTFKPDLFEAVVKNNRKKLIRVIALLLGSISLISVIFIILCPFIIQILTAGRYMQSTPYAQIGALSVVTSMMYYVASEITIAKGYTYIALINSVISSLLCILVFYFLISRFQFVGAAWGLVLAFIVKLIGNLALIPFFNYRKNAT